MILNDKSSGAQKQPGPGEAVKLALQGFQRPALPPLAPSTPLQRTPSALSDRDITDEHPKDPVAPFYFCGLAASFCFSGSAASFCFSGLAASFCFSGSAASFCFSGSAASFRFSRINKNNNKNNK